MLEIYTSAASHGSMKSSNGHFAAVLPTRAAFLQKNNLNPNDTTLVHLMYEGSDYARYKTIENEYRGDGIVRAPSFVADGVATRQHNLALFLPLADCIGAVLHDPQTNTLMLTHLGRHNLEQTGGTKSVEYMVREHGVNPRNLTAWLSPRCRTRKLSAVCF